MEVIALKGFVHFKPDGDWIMAQEGQVVDLPNGAEYIRAGLAMPVTKPYKTSKKHVSKPVETAVELTGEITRPPEAKRRKSK